MAMSPPASGRHAFAAECARSVSNATLAAIPPGTVLTVMQACRMGPNL